MAKTSHRVAKLASKLLRRDLSRRNEKSVAGGALQAHKSKKKK